ncbi:transposase [Nonomuraea thailandensis]|uniref:transposase n=1 Tax=Nonomuraea thailandensis TaxID=1188745 RepID=UPI0031EF95FF
MCKLNAENALAAIFWKKWCRSANLLRDRATFRERNGGYPSPSPAGRSAAVVRHRPPLLSPATQKTPVHAWPAGTAAEPTTHTGRPGCTTDLSDAERQVIEPLMPWPTWLHGKGGRAEKYCRGLIVDAIRYVADNGCKWRNLPADFLAPWRTVHAIFTRWWTDGNLYALHNDLREQVRIADGREPEPSAGIIDSQSLRAAETVAAGSRGYDLPKKVQGTKQHIIVDALGLLLVVIVTAASVQDRERTLSWMFRRRRCVREYKR